MTRLISQERSVTVYESDLISLRYEIGADVDPTTTAPEFMLTAPTVTDPGLAGWSIGSWESSTYGNAGTSWTYVYTPTIGNVNATLRVTSNNRYLLWCRIPDLGVEDPILRCGVIWCP